MSLTDTSFMRPGRLLHGDLIVVGAEPAVRYDAYWGEWVEAGEPIFREVMRTVSDYHGVMVTFMDGTQRAYPHDEWIEVARG